MGSDKVPLLCSYRRCCVHIVAVCLCALAFYLYKKDAIERMRVYGVSGKEGSGPLRVGGRISGFAHCKAFLFLLLFYLLFVVVASALCSRAHLIR